MRTEETTRIVLHPTLGELTKNVRVTFDESKHENAQAALARHEVYKNELATMQQTFNDGDISEEEFQTWQDNADKGILNMEHIPN